MKKIPTTIITGFLGAGKTTLIHHLLENSRGKRLALIINEFGDLGVDGEILGNCTNENREEHNLIELTNGCICCTVAEEFKPALETILDRRPQPDHIIIETSGLALPQPLLRAFNWPGINTKVTVDGVIVVVDGPAYNSGQFASDVEAIKTQRENDPELDHTTPLSELFKDQLNCGDLIILNKVDQLTPSTINQLSKQLQDATREGVSIIHSSKKGIDPSLLLGLNFCSENGLEQRQEIHHLHSNESHDHHHEHDHDAFESWVVDLPAFSNLERIKNSVHSAIINHKILRVKGFGAIKGVPRRLVIQAVGPRIDCYFDQTFDEAEPFSSKLVFISETGVDKTSLFEQLKKAAI